MSEPLFYTEEGVEVYTDDLVTSVTVSRKAGLPGYGNEVFFSRTASIPAGMANTEIVRQVERDLYAAVKHNAEGVAAAAQEQQSTPGAPSPHPPAPQQTMPTTQPAAEPAHNGQDVPPLVNFLRASDRTPGDVYRVVVDRCEVDGKQIKFFGEGSQYSKLSSYIDRADVVKHFGTIAEDAGALGYERALIFTIRVLDKKAGNWWDQEIVAVAQK